jgi:hypothetical protein
MMAMLMMMARFVSRMFVLQRHREKKWCSWSRFGISKCAFFCRHITQICNIVLVVVVVVVVVVAFRGTQSQYDGYAFSCD